MIGINTMGQALCLLDQNTTYSGADFVLSGQGCDPGFVVRESIDQTTSLKTDFP